MRKGGTSHTKPLDFRPNGMGLPGDQEQRQYVLEYLVLT